jgi:uncharacterized protein
VSRAVPHFPGVAPITAYGNGGFRFADMSHRGSILCLPSGVYAWDADTFETLAPHHFAFALSEISAPIVLLVGTGATQQWPNAELTKVFADSGVGLEPMATGAAARTYNILLAEKRTVAAALIAVE